MSGNPTKNTVIRVLFVLALLFAIVVVIAQITAKSAVADFLERKLPHHVQLKYENMDANVLSGTIGLRDISIDFYDRDSMLLNTKVTMDAIALEGLSYWDFLVNSKIDVRHLLLERPQVRHYPYRMLPKKYKEPEGVVQLLKVISLKELSVQNGSLDLLRDDVDSIALALRNLNFSVENTSTGPDQIVKRIPVDYGNYEMNADSLYVNLGPYEKLDVAGIHWNREGARITGLQLQSKFGKRALSTHLMEERDHVDLKIPEMRLDSIRFGFEKDTFFIVTGKGIIDQPALELYRDKFVADDKATKKLYSRSIRQLPIHIDVPEIEIVNGTVVYSERVADVSNPGKLSFKSLNATLSNISNTYASGEKTLIKARTKFMGEADMTLDWSFDINRTNDAFFASGTVSNFNATSINPFLESNVRAKASGSIDELYFTINGNSISSSGDMKMKYQDFRFQVLKKNRLGINKLLTAIGNIFIDDGSKTDAAGFRYGNIAAERDPTKSFFNYLWLNVRNGTLSTLTGNGEKD